jgi:hypothetical protein
VKSLNNPKLYKLTKKEFSMNKIYSAKTVRELIESLFTIDEENKVFKKNEITDKVANKVWRFHYISLISILKAFPDSPIVNFSLLDFEVAIRQYVREMSEKGFKNPMATGSNFLVIGFENAGKAIASSTEGWSVMEFDPYKEESNHVFGMIEKQGQKVFPIFDSLPEAESFRRKTEEFYGKKQTLVYFDLNNYLCPIAVSNYGVGFVNDDRMDNGVVIDLSECENGDIIKFSDEISVQKTDDWDYCYYAGRFKKVNKGTIHTNFYTNRKDVSGYLVITKNGTNLVSAGSRNLVNIEIFKDFMREYYKGKFPKGEIKGIYVWDLSEKFAEFVRKGYDQECSIGKAYYSLIYYIRTARFTNNQYGLSVSILTDEDDGSLILVDNAEDGTPYDPNTMSFVNEYRDRGYFTNLKTEHYIDKMIPLDDDEVVYLYFRHKLPKV